MAKETLRILIVEDDIWRAREIAIMLPEGFLPVIVKSAGAALGLLLNVTGAMFMPGCALIMTCKGRP